MRNEDKADLRRALRLGYPGREARARESERLCRHLLDCPWYREARTVGAYLPMAREADILPVVKDVLRSGRRLTLPRIEGPGRMTMRQVTRLEELTPGAYGIPSPGADAPVVSARELALIIVPLEGIDRRGVRLGKGGGFYDGYLREVRCPSLGAALSWQWRETLPADPWDVLLDGAVDCAGFCLFQR